MQIAAVDKSAATCMCVLALGEALAKQWGARLAAEKVRGGGGVPGPQKTATLLLLPAAACCCWWLLLAAAGRCWPLLPAAEL